MKKQAVILGGIVIVVISSMGGTTALSFLADQQWSNYVQSWKTPKVVGEKKKLSIAENDTITICISKR
jgi:hypothetical protein